MESLREMPIWLITIFAVIVVAMITFIYQWFISGYSLYNEVGSEKDKLKNDILKIKNKDDIVSKLTIFYSDGKEFYESAFGSTIKTQEIWIKRLTEWSNSVESFLNSNVNARAVHMFKNRIEQVGILHHNSEELMKDEKNQLMAEKFTGMLGVVNELIEEQRSDWRNDIDLNKK